MIKIWEYDTEKDQIVEGSDQVVVNGGVDLSQKPIWDRGSAPLQEGRQILPHVRRRRHGRLAQRGDIHRRQPQGTLHARTREPHTLTAPPSGRDRPDKVDWAGHADLVEGPDGKYWGVFLAIRPNETNRVNTGRETFILPVDWSGTFPVFEGGMEPLKPKLKMPAGVENHCGEDGFLPNGNFTFSDGFASADLDPRWVGVRGAREHFASVGGARTCNQALRCEHQGARVPPRRSSTASSTTPSPPPPRSTTYPRSSSDLAGLTCYQSEAFNYVFGITKCGDQTAIVLQRTARGKSETVASATVGNRLPVGLRVSAEGDKYTFSYAERGGEYADLATVSGDILSTNVAGGFTGAMIGLYATAANDATCK